MTWKEKMSVGLLCTRDVDEHHVRVYQDRLAIWRRDGARMTWEELQGVKEAVWPGQTAIEYYPPQSRVVNLRHTRHLWRYDGALPRHPEFPL